jgi:hypothetical protein
MTTTESKNPAICAGCDITLTIAADPKWAMRLRVWPEANFTVQVPYTLCQVCQDKLVELLRKDDRTEARAFMVKCYGNVRSLYAYLPPSLVALMADEQRVSAATVGDNSHG